MTVRRQAGRVSSGKKHRDRLLNRRRWIERLEDRRLLATMPLLADGAVLDGNGDGTFDQVLMSGSSLQIRQFTGTGIDRAVAEYDTSSLPAGATISSAHLTFRSVAFTANSERRVDVVAYAGDGTINVADATTAGTVVATYDSYELGLGEHTINLNTAALQDLVGQDNITLRLQAFGETVNTAIAASESLSYDGPQLDINFVVPAELTLTVAADTISEGAGAVATTATLARTDADVSQPLTANLFSNDTTELAVPPQVTIPAGQASVTFNVDAVDDDLLDGTQPVTITATEVLAGGVSLDSSHSQTATQLQVRSSDSYPDIVLLPDQSAIVVGDAASATDDAWQVTKVLPDGGIDTSFGNGGVVVTSFRAALQFGGRRFTARDRFTSGRKNRGRRGSERGDECL